jgi:uncharacterized protein (DUF362 family)
MPFGWIMAMRPSGSDGAGLSRRHFLGTIAVPLVAAAACSRRPYNAVEFVHDTESAVAILPAASYAVDFAELIGRGLRETGLDLHGKRVLLKPNIVEYESGTAINTHPMVVAGAAVAMRMAGASEVIVGEGPGHRRDSEYLITASGLYEHLRDHNVRFVDLNQDDVTVVPLRSRYTRMTSLAFPDELLRADVIVSMPKLKTHHWAGMTASMKNLFGTVPGAVYGWPKNILHAHGIDESIVDLTATLRPHLSIVDAVTAMEGDGPIMGRPRHMGFVAMGRDLVAVDATCARIIGLDPAKIPYLRIAAAFLGNAEEGRIQQRGENPGRYATTFDVVDAIKPFRLGQSGSPSTALAPTAG